MTGRELIAWIVEHEAEDLEIVGMNVDNDYSPIDEPWIALERVVIEGE